MLATGTSGLMSGEGKRIAHQRYTAPFLDSTDDVRFGAWAALGDFGRTGSFGYFTV